MLQSDLVELLQIRSRFRRQLRAYFIEYIFSYWLIWTLGQIYQSFCANTSLRRLPFFTTWLFYRSQGRHFSITTDKYVTSMMYPHHFAYIYSAKYKWTTISFLVLFVGETQYTKRIAPNLPEKTAISGANFTY